jgi:hypothetical protein
MVPSAEKLEDLEDPSSIKARTQLLLYEMITKHFVENGTLP